MTAPAAGGRGDDVFELFSPDRASGGVRVCLPDPVVFVLAEAAARDEAADPYAGCGALAASAPDADVLDHLEAEIVSDAMAQAQADRRLETVEVARRLAAAAVRWQGVDTTVSASDAQALLEWLNRMYVTLRRAQLAGSGSPARVGVAQSAIALLGLDDVDTDTADGDSDADSNSDGLDPASLLFAALVVSLQECLLGISEDDGAS